MTENEYKIVVVGDGGVGKSALIIQLMQNMFTEEYDPTIEDSYRKLYTVDNKEYLLDILDTAGQEEYSSIRDQYVRSGSGFLVVFGLNNAKSLSECQSFIKEIRNIKGANFKPILLVGNKCDIDQGRVNPEDINTLRKDASVDYVEVSAKRRINVDVLFSTIVRLIRDQSITNTPKSKKSKGCKLL